MRILIIILIICLCGCSKREHISEYHQAAHELRGAIRDYDVAESGAFEDYLREWARARDQLTK